MAENYTVEGLDFILGLCPDNSQSPPANLYLGLFYGTSGTSVPASGAVLATQTGVTEVTGTGYARQTIAAADWGSFANTPSDNGRRQTASTKTFTASGTWSEAAGFFIATAATSGVALFYANFDDNTTVTLNNTDELNVTPWMGFTV